MSQLPISHVLPELLSALDTHSQLIVKAAPGAGKSTYLPLMIFKHWQVNKPQHGKIIMMEPRRLAARNIAQYLSSLLGEKLGETVGYRMRGESKVSAKTRIEIVTEGVMTRMLQNDPELDGVELVIFDEYHERSLHADTALALCLDVQQGLRDDLKLMVMSATLDASALSRLLNEAYFIESQGRSYPIDYHYFPLDKHQRYLPYLAKMLPIWLDQFTGSMLVFLPGVGEIKHLQNLLQESKSLSAEVAVLPLYGQLSNQDQQVSISPTQKGQRKVVLATNVAETSLTIEGIHIVVDSGLERVASFDPKSGITRLESKRISQSSAQQRAGRAGRLASGVCLRLYSEEELQRQAIVPTAEILRSDLSPLFIELLSWGVKDPSELTWMDLPPVAHIEQAKSLLTQLGLLEDHQQLTALAKQASTLGVEPRIASMLLRAQQIEGCSLSSAVAFAALIEEPERNQVNLADSWLNVTNKKHAKSSLIVRRCQSLSQKLGGQFQIDKVQLGWFGVCAALAFPDRVAMKRSQGEQYQLANGHGAYLDEAEALSNASLLVVIDLVRSERSMSSRILRGVEISSEQLWHSLRHLIEETPVAYWDERQGKMRSETQQRWGGLILERKPLDNLSPQIIQGALLDYIRRKGIDALPWTKESRALLIRMRNAAEWLPEQSWPSMSDEALLENLEDWLAPYLSKITNVDKLKSLDLKQILNNLLGWPLNQQIDQWLPTHYVLPTGTKKAIRYQEQGEPILSVRMQEMFGESSTPTVAQGRKKLVVELLSPAQRPLQVTQDLAGFWQGSYKEVQKEMKGRYPKHIWPDDPGTHKPTTKLKKHLS